MKRDRTRLGPLRSDSQRIGTDADSAFRANLPADWTLSEIGANDFGVDFQATVFSPHDSSGQFHCNIQLKGTTQDKARLADGQHISFAFDRSTLNTWHRSGTIVLVVLVDLVDTRDPKHAIVHYLFASPVLERVLHELPSTQETVTLRIPRSQVVTRDLDILPLVEPYLAELEDARRLARDRQLGTGANNSVTTSLVVTTNTSSVTAEALEGDSIELVIERSENNDVASNTLKELRSGRYDTVLDLTNRLNTEPPSDFALHAVFLYLRAQALAARDRSAEAKACLDRAAELLPENDDIVAAIAQRELDKIAYGPSGMEDRTKLLTSISGKDGANVRSIAAKILSLEGRFDDARALISQFSIRKVGITRVIVSIVERSWERASREARDVADLADATPMQRLTAEILDVKALFQLALGPVDWPEAGDLIIPASGITGIDQEKMRDTYTKSFKAMMKAQAADWPPPTEYLLDSLAISAMYFGKESEVVPLLSAFAIAKPSNEQARQTAIKLALNADKPGLALEIADKSDEKVHGDEALLAVAACRIGNFSKALEFLRIAQNEEPNNRDELLLAHMTVGIAADSAMMPSVLDEIRTILGGSIDGMNFKAIMECTIKVHRSALSRTEAIDDLYSYWEENQKPLVISNHILINADSTDLKEARVIQEVSEHILQSSPLDAERLAIYGQALLTLEKYLAGEGLLRDARDRYPSDAKIASLLGIALELNGKQSEAYALFEALADTGSASDSARRYFVNIAARIGRADVAESQVRNALAKAGTNRSRFQLVMTLYQLALQQDKFQELSALAWQCGDLANSEDEREEGIFLQQVLTANILSDNKIPERQEEYEKRMEIYAERFPRSQYLRRFQLPENEEHVGIVKTLQAAVGLTDQDLLNAAKTERKLDKGVLLVPFSWRPRRFLLNVSDVLMLWDLNVRTGTNKGSLHFDSEAGSLERKHPERMDSYEVVLSITSILVLDEIGILELVLDTFSKVIVARSALVLLQNARNPLTGGWGRDKASGILELLRKHIRKIEHPPYATAPEGIAPAWHLEDVIGMASERRIYFCDDIVETVLVCGYDEVNNVMQKPSISSLDFISWADQGLGLLNTERAAELVGRLIDIKVGGLRVASRYVVAAIPEKLQVAVTTGEIQQAYENAAALRSILRGIWGPEKSYSDIRNHFVAIQIYLLKEGNGSNGVLVALWVRWVDAVRFLADSKLTTLGKLSTSFVLILESVYQDANLVHRLWRILWATIEAVLPDITEPSDTLGVREIASILGRESLKESELLIQDISFSARYGLGESTALSDLYQSEYVRSAAQAAEELQGP